MTIFVELCEPPSAHCDSRAGLRSDERRVIARLVAAESVLPGLARWSAAAVQVARQRGDGHAHDMGTWLVTDTYDEAIVAGTLALLSQEWWTRHRQPEDVDASLRASQLVFTAADSDGQIVGTARVLTDFVYLATVLDVISSRAHRGEGIGAALMEAITEHVRLRSVDSIELVCQPELEDFYARWGFSAEVGRSGLMRRTSNPTLGGPATSE